MNKTDHPLYNTWRNMIDRTTNQKHPSFKLNEKRGVVVCKRWRNSFNAFLRDMGDKPTPMHQLKRYSRYQDYRKSNCYWHLSKRHEPVAEMAPKPKTPSQTQQLSLRLL